MKGNPPRKNNYSYGDAIIWETLLDVATKDDLAIITGDSDFIEKRKGTPTLRGFLSKEWSEKTRKKIELFVSLGEFINKYEKKSTITPKVIEEEKARVTKVLNFEPIYADKLSAFSNLPSSFPIDNVPYVSLNSPYFGGNSASSFVNHTANNLALNGSIKYCPYCSKQIGNNWELDMGVHFGSKKYTCPHCHSSFDIG